MNGDTLAEQFTTVSQRPRTRQLGALPLLLPILEGLGLCAKVNHLRPSKAEIDLGRIALLMALNRLMAPRPLSGIPDWAKTTVVGSILALPSEELYDVRLGRALDAIFPILERLWAELATEAIRQEGVDLSVLHWDLTSCYFEGDYEASDLARFGYSRDKRHDTKQVNLGIDVTGSEHVPVRYAVLPGNTDDQTTPVANLVALVEFLGRADLAMLPDRPLIVSDCKMVTDEAVLACHRYGFSYLGPLPSDELRTASIIEGVSNEELKANQLAYRPRHRPPAGQPFVPYRGVWRTATFVYEGRSVTDRALVVWSAGKERLDIERRKTLLKRVLEGLANIQDHLNQRQYRSRDYVIKRLARVCTGSVARLVEVRLEGTDGTLRLHFAIDRAKLKAVQAHDGKYVLATNAGRLGADAALETFKEQDAVEKAIATIKGPLVVRPFYVENDERIEGLVFFNLLALLVWAVLGLRLKRAGLASSVVQALAAFDPLQIVEVGFSDGSAARWVAEPTPTQCSILGALRLPSLERYQTGISLALR